MSDTFDGLLAGGLLDDSLPPLPDLPDLPELMQTTAQPALPSASLAMVRPDEPTSFGFPASLPIELAAGLASLADIQEAYGITLEQLAALQKNELFRTEYDRALAVRKEPNGLVKLQAMLMLPKVLESQFKITQDTDMPPAVRVKAGENIMAIPSELYPKKAVDSGPVAQSINIVFNAPPAGFAPSVQRGVKVEGATYDAEEN